MAFEAPNLLSINHFLEGICMQGRVTKVDTNKRIAATVTYPDRKYQSTFLQVLQRNTIGSQDHYVPEPGENVWVLHPPRARSRGLILGSTYTAKNPPPYNVQTTRGMLFNDGTFIIYDYANHNYQVNIQGKYTLVTTGDANLTVQGDMTTAVTNTAKTTAQQINMNGVTIDSAGNVRIPGNLTVVGTLTVTGQTTVGNIQINGTESGGGSV